MANISEISIKRPVLSTVMMLVLLLFGMIGYKFLGVREFPSVDNPIISVNVSYPGANAEVIMNQITEPLEQNINGIPGIRSLSSVRVVPVLRSNSNCQSIWKQRQMMCVIRFHVPNVICLATAILRLYRKPMRMRLLSCRLVSEAVNAH